MRSLVRLCLFKKPDHIPKEEILNELKEIETNLNELEKRGVELEKELRQCDEGLYMRAPFTMHQSSIKICRHEQMHFPAQLIPPLLLEGLDTCMCVQREELFMFICM